MNDRNREGWVRVGEDWYMVSSDPMNWYEAQEVRIYFIYCFVLRGILSVFQYCWNHGGYLAEFLTSEQELQAETFIRDDGRYWIGLSDRHNEGKILS